MEFFNNIHPTWSFVRVIMGVGFGATAPEAVRQHE